MAIAIHKLKSLVTWLKWELSTLLRLQEQRFKMQLQSQLLLTTEVMVADAPKDESATHDALIWAECPAWAGWAEWAG